MIPSQVADPIHTYSIFSAISDGVCRGGAVVLCLSCVPYRLQLLQAAICHHLERILSTSKEKREKRLKRDHSWHCRWGGFEKGLRMFRAYSNCTSYGFQAVSERPLKCVNGAAGPRQ